MPPVPPSRNNYQVIPAFTGKDGAGGGVYLLPPNYTFGGDTVLTILLLYNSTNPPPASYRNSDFQIACTLIQPGTQWGQGTASVVITLIGSGNMWKAAPSARTALMASFVDFLQNVETTFELPGFLIPGATFRIGQQIADNLPAPLLDTLFYRYSFATGLAGAQLSAPPGSAAYVDVRPGMQLRVETQSSQFVTPGSALNGYISSGLFPLIVGSTPAPPPATGRLVTFDPFLGSIKTPAINAATGTPLVAGGVIDLEPSGGARTYCRLFYPPALSAPFQPGQLDTATNVTLVGAQTLAQLNAATTAYPAQNTGGTPPNVYTIFLGRAIAVPEIPVWITVRSITTMEYVPIGTTLANIIERFVPLPLSVSTALTLLRTTSASAQGPSLTVVLNTNQLQAIPSSMLDLPLIAGDSITLNNV